jgi:hypothetical protein
MMVKILDYYKSDMLILALWCLWSLQKLSALLKHIVYLLRIHTYLVSKKWGQRILTYLYWQEESQRQGHEPGGFNLGNCK